MFKKLLATLALAVSVFVAPVYAANWVLDFNSPRTSEEYTKTLTGLTVTSNGWTIGEDCDNCTLTFPDTTQSQCVNAWHWPAEPIDGTCNPTSAGHWSPDDLYWNQFSNFANEYTSGKALSVMHPLMADDAHGICSLPYLHFSRNDIRYAKIWYSAAFWECTECYPNFTCCSVGALDYDGQGGGAKVMALRHDQGPGCAWTLYGESGLTEDGSVWGTNCEGDPNGDFCEWPAVEVVGSSGFDYLLFAINPYNPWNYGKSYPHFYISRIELSTDSCANPPCEFERATQVHDEQPTDTKRTSWGQLKLIYR